LKYVIQGKPTGDVHETPYEKHFPFPYKQFLTQTSNRK